MELDVLKVTWRRTFKVWWRLVWRFYVFGALIMLPLGFVSTLAGSLLGDVVSGDTIVIFKGLQSVIMSVFLILLSIGVLQYVLKNKKFSDFEIVLCSKKLKDEPKE